MCHAMGEDFSDIFHEQDIIQLNNMIPKDLIPFEGVFDKND